MKESQIHDGFMLWLKRNNLFFIHAAFGKKSSMTKDAPDFSIIHANRAILIEVKTEKGGLTDGQKKLFAKLRADSGIVVRICRSVEECVKTVREWLGDIDAPPLPGNALADPKDYGIGAWSSDQRATINCEIKEDFPQIFGMPVVIDENTPPGIVRVVNAGSTSQVSGDYRIGQWMGRDWLIHINRQRNQETMMRPATPQDVLKYGRKNES